MRRKAFLAILAVAVIGVACAQSDAGITTKVKTKLTTDDTVKAYQIDVDTKNNVVTLSGNVETEAARTRAIELAKATSGVREVVDHLTVAGGAAALPGEHPAATGAYGTGSTAAPAKGGEGDGAVGGNAPSTDRSAGQVVDDAAITAAVKSKLLADPKVGGLKIDVDTRNGVVYLTGDHMKSPAEIEQAVRLARETNGVKSVENKLAVGDVKNR